jgi:hypothetical protein
MYIVATGLHGLPPLGRRHELMGTSSLLEWLRPYKTQPDRSGMRMDTEAQAITS